MRRVFRARWLLPIDRPPIANGWIAVQDGLIASISPGPPPSGAVDLGNAAVLPGLVNAHTHIELSWMAGRVPPADSFGDWLHALIALRNAGPPGEEVAIAAAEQALVESRRCGTVLVGDVSNTLMSARLLAANGIGGVVF